MKVTKALALEGPDGWATIGPTKTDNRVRTLPLHSLAARALRAWYATGWARHVGRAPNATDPVFANDDGKAWRPNMAPMLRADLRNAGLPDTYEGHNLTAHAMRRSFSTWLSEAGVDSHTRDRLMGHAATSTAEKHYTAVILTRLRDAVESIKIDLTTPRVIALPMRSAVGTEPLSELAIDPPQAAGLTAARGKGEEDWAKTSVIPSAPRRSRTCDLRLRRRTRSVSMSVIAQRCAIARGTVAMN